MTGRRCRGLDVPAAPSFASFYHGCGGQSDFGQVCPGGAGSDCIAFLVMAYIVVAYLGIAYMLIAYLGVA